MAPAKKQKTGEDSSNVTQQAELDSSTPQKNTKTRDPTKIPPYEYVCFNRPFFDYKVENRNLSDDELDFEELEEKFEDEQSESEENNITLEPANDHPEWKWVILFEGWKMFCDYKRRANYCSPDLFNLEMCNDYEGWGYQELVENWMLDFDTAFKKKKEKSSCDHMWAVISGLGLWVNVVNMGPLYGCEYGEKTAALCELVGNALLTALATLDRAGELKPDSTFKDLAKVIAEYLEWSSDHEDYGIQDEAVDWRPHAAAYFKKAKLETDNGLGSTAKLLKEIEDEEGGQTKDPGIDPWGWGKALKKYKKHYGPKIGGTHFDITKMSRKERADASYDGVDPLKDIPDEDLKAGNLDFD